MELKTYKEVHPIHTELNVFGEWDSIYDFNYADEDERSFAEYYIKEENWEYDGLTEIKDEEDFDTFITNLGDDDETFYNYYALYLEEKYPEYEFFCHTIDKPNQDDVYFIIEAKKIKGEKND